MSATGSAFRSLYPICRQITRICGGSVANGPRPALRKRTPAAQISPPSIYERYFETSRFASRLSLAFASFSMRRGPHPTGFMFLTTNMS